MVFWLCICGTHALPAEVGGQPQKLHARFGAENQTLSGFGRSHMPTERESLSAKVQSSYQQLSKVAADLNAVSDELGKSIAELDAALKKLNLGVTTWIQVQLVRDPQTADFEGDYLGYAKVGGKWGIALRKTSGNYNYAPDEPPEEWPFNEGPRELRLEAIEKIPELLNKLSEAATKMAANVRDRLGEAQQVAEAIKLVANDPKSSRAASKQTGGH